MATSALGQARAFWAQSSKHGRKWNSCNSFSKAGKWCCRSLKNHEHSPTSNKATSFEKALSIASVLPFNFFDTNGNLACPIICANIVLNICPFCKGPAPLRPRSAAARAHLSPQAAARHISTTLTSNGNAYRNEKIENTIYSYIYIYVYWMYWIVFDIFIICYRSLCMCAVRVYWQNKDLAMESWHNVLERPSWRSCAPPAFLLLPRSRKFNSQFSRPDMDAPQVECLETCKHTEHKTKRTSCGIAHCVCILNVANVWTCLGLWKTSPMPLAIVPTLTFSLLSKS